MQPGIADDNTPNELWYGQGAFKTQRNETQYVYKSG